MLTIFLGEQRRGKIKLTTDRDCLAPDIIRFDSLVLPTIEDVKGLAKRYEERGFKVCVDTEDYFYETPVRMLDERE